jgi:hypothetical protein
MPEPQEESELESGEEEEKKMEPVATAVSSSPLKLEKKKQTKEVKKVENFLKLMRLVSMLNSKIDLERFKRNMWNVCSLE